MKGGLTGHGWKSNYDYPEMSNVEKYLGRKLHVQDNFWTMAKIIFVVVGGLVVYLIIDGDLNFKGIIDFYNLMK